MAKKALLVVVLLLHVASLYAQNDTSAAVWGGWGCTTSALSLYPEPRRDTVGDMVRYVDTAGYGVSMITGGDCPDTKIGKITITGDTMQSFHYALQQYIELRDRSADQQALLWEEIERLRRREKQLMKAINDLYKLNMKFASDVKKIGTGKK